LLAVRHGEPVRGVSSITQQLARNLFLTLRYGPTAANSKKPASRFCWSGTSRRREFLSCT
jgi:hypothetical protein